MFSLCFHIPLEGGDSMRKQVERYAVSGYIGTILERRIIEAYTARQACYRFCREFRLDEVEDVLSLRAVNINNPADAFWAKM